MAHKDLEIKRPEEVVIRFAGDSGDGMQLTGSLFAEIAAIIGNDLSTLPDFPSEIRAPTGSLAGVSAFQLHFSSKGIYTPGDQVDVLVAMNPAALRVHEQDLVEGGMIIANSNAFTEKNLEVVGYKENPLQDGSLDKRYTVYDVEMTKLVEEACKDMKLPAKAVSKTKNMFALGLLFWLFNRPRESTIKWLNTKFKNKPDIIEANTRALRTGYNYGETAEFFMTRYQVAKATLPSGTYRNISGNYALSLGLLTASEKAGIPLFYGGYPITPASEILHTLSAWKHFGIKTFQAEDEIAGICSAIGAAFAGNLAITATSGPGLALKTEAMGLGVMAELPLVIVNVMRGGPSTGLPTKTEQSDLFQSLYGRNGEAPIPVVAPYSPGDCFFAAYEACRVAIKYMTPIILLTDGYLVYGTEPWAIPELEVLPPIDVKFVKPGDNGSKFHPYERNERTLARPWAIPGTPGMEHRIGGLEKEDITGNISYDPDNHQKMVNYRKQKVANIINDIPPIQVFGPSSGDLLILGWGSTYGSIRTAVEEMHKEGFMVSHAHLRWINPLPKDLGMLLSRFKSIIIPEVNTGQLLKVIRAEYLVDAKGLNQVRGTPIAAKDITSFAREIVEENHVRST